MIQKTVLRLITAAAFLSFAASMVDADDCINGNCGGGSAAAGGAFYGGATGGSNAFGANWGGAPGARDCNRFYHYPYVYYPQNFYGSEYYRSSNSMYYRYPAEMQIPVYNRGWHNEYPSPRRYHSGHHFLTDVF